MFMQGTSNASGMPCAGAVLPRPADSCLRSSAFPAVLDAVMLQGSPLLNPQSGFSAQFAQPKPMRGGGAQSFLAKKKNPVSQVPAPRQERSSGRAAGE